MGGIYLFFFLRSFMSSKTNAYFFPNQFLASLYNSPHVRVLLCFMVDFLWHLCGNFSVLEQVGGVCNLYVSL